MMAISVIFAKRPFPKPKYLSDKTDESDVLFYFISYAMGDAAYIS